MSQNKSAAIADLPLSVGEDANEAVKQLIAGSVGTIILLLNSRNEALQVEASAQIMSLEEIAKRLPAKEPRFAMHKFVHEVESKQMAPWVFMYYCPDTAPPKLKMTYSSFKSIVVKWAEKQGVTVTKQFEFSETQELTTQALHTELYPKLSEKKVFAKPKKPGKGKGKLTADTKFDSAK